MPLILVGNLAVAPSMASLSKQCSMMYGLSDMENNLALPLLTISACPLYLNLSLSTLQFITILLEVIVAPDATNMGNRHIHTVTRCIS